MHLWPSRPQDRSARYSLLRSAALAASVLFSSVAGLLGSGGQANYSAANAVIDTWAATQHMQVPHLMCCRSKTRHKSPFEFSIMDFLRWVHPCSLHPLMSGNRCIRIYYSCGSKWVMHAQGLPSISAQWGAWAQRAWSATRPGLQTIWRAWDWASCDPRRVCMLSAL